MSLAVTHNRFRTSDGTSLFVDESGPADAPVTLVLAHGWTLDHTSWDPVVAALPSTVRVVQSPSSLRTMAPPNSLAVRLCCH